MQYGGGNCRLCGSPRTTATSCPDGPTANPNWKKHPLAKRKKPSVKPKSPSPVHVPSPHPPVPIEKIKPGKKKPTKRLVKASILPICKLPSVGATKCPAGPPGKGTGCGSVEMGNYYCLYDNGPNPNITDFLTGLEYEHTTYEQGTGGDCLYCTLAAGINQRDRLIHRDDRVVSMADIRAMIADNVLKMDPEIASLVLLQDGQDAKFDPSDVQTLADHIRATHGPRKEGTEFDLKIFLELFPDVGVLMFNAQTGQIYCTNLDDSPKTHYILILWDYARRVGNKYDDGTAFETPGQPPNHYRALALRPEGSEQEFQYVYQCKDLPPFLIPVINDQCKVKIVC